jgi:hypothetical protein
MLKRLFDGTDLAQLRAVVSPAFFDVIPARVLWQQGRTLALRYRDERAYSEALSRRAATLDGAELGVGIGVVDPDESEEIEDPIARGEALLRLYFHQLLTEGPALLDLRRHRFASRGDRYAFDPGRLTFDWDEGFRGAMRGMYAGFYGGDDERFVRSLDLLGLRHAEGTFRRQFGSGDQRSARFEMKAFVGSFHEAFVACREAGDRLHPGFLAFGVYLAFLYDHLESLGGGPFDVRAAYEAVAGQRIADAA